MFIQVVNHSSSFRSKDVLYHDLPLLWIFCNLKVLLICLFPVAWQSSMIYRYQRHIVLSTLLVVNGSSMVRAITRVHCLSIQRRTLILQTNPIHFPFLDVDNWPRDYRFRMSDQRATSCRRRSALYERFSRRQQHWEGGGYYRAAILGGPWACERSSKAMSYLLRVSWSYPSWICLGGRGKGPWRPQFYQSYIGEVLEWLG